LTHLALGLTYNKETQLSLRKTRYSLYTFYCSTDLHGHPRSMTFISSEKVYVTSHYWLMVISPFSR